MPILNSALAATLEGEIEDHLEQARSNKNRRNGKTVKTVKHSTGGFELETPRDRDGSFEPEIVKKRQAVLNQALDDKILGMFSIGMSYDDIRMHLAEVYDLDISAAKISAVTDKLLPIITEKTVSSAFKLCFSRKYW